ncbi:MAG: hypothetical protein ROY99_05565 [Ignavibacterium sp.]|jgi:hypothetical protein|nr:hypothetical protein [Ignavibacterium sp.]
MLKKIENIANANELKGNNRYSGGSSSLSVINGNKSNISDSLSFSSAFKYLSSLKWQLKSLEHNSNDEFTIEFIVDKLLFKTRISINDNKTSDINYSITNGAVVSTSEHKYDVTISFDFDPQVFSEAPTASSTEYLNWLFEKFVSYDSILLKNSNDPEINSFFLDGAEKKLQYELSLIHRNIISFVEKVSGEVITNHLRYFSPDSSNKKIIKILNINVRL